MRWRGSSCGAFRLTNPGFAVSCGGCVNLPSSQTMLAAFKGELQRIESEVCVPAAEACREADATNDLGGAGFGSGCGHLNVICRNGSCTQVSR